MGGETPVGPLALLPLIVLSVVWLGPRLVRGGRLPALSGPLLAFALLAVVSAAAATALPIEGYKGQTPLTREIRAMATLAIGLAFYLSSAVVPDSESKLESSLRAIHIGGLAMMVWSAVQGWVVLRAPDHVPLVITQIHHWFSVRDPLVDRVTGLAYEPSWLGNQLMVLYLPLLFASVALGKSVFSARRSRLSLELGLLIAGLAMLVLTRSRISVLSLITAAGAVYLVLGWRIVGRRILARVPQRWPWPARTLAGALVALALLAGLVGLVAGAAAAVSRADDRMDALSGVIGRIPEARYLFPNEAAYEIGSRLAVAERFVYWTVAFRAFADHPLLGVGPGNTGFFFERNRPPYGDQLTEIRNVIDDPSFGFPNPKNLWLRILAENGILGLATFGVWFGLMAAASLSLWRGVHGVDKLIGLAGALAVLIQLIEGFSLDTYALPQLWIVFGLVTAAAWRRQPLELER
jgi:O-antigen ligase